MPAIRCGNMTASLQMLRNVMLMLLAVACGLPGFVSAQPLSLKLKDLEWLLGAWKRESARSITFERWRKLSDKTFEGESVRRSKATGDSVLVESLVLAEMGGEIFYLAKVDENRLPVAFRLTSLAGGRAVFENPEHDFPQRITYILNADDSLLVITAGKEGGQDEEQQIEFSFQKHR